VRVLDGGDVVAASQPAIVASPIAEIDLVVDAAHVHAPTEYERIHSDVAARIGGVDIGALREDAQSRDLTFLAGVTIWSTAQLVDLVMAVRLGAASKLDPTFFYALLREDALVGAGSSSLSARFDVTLASPTQGLFYDVVLLPGDRVRAAVGSAIAARVVP